MLRCGSPLAAAHAGHEVIHLPRSDAARVFHTRLKVRIGYRLQRPTKVCALTGSLPLFQKSSRGLCHLISGPVFFLSYKLPLLSLCSGAVSPAARWPRRSRSTHARWPSPPLALSCARDRSTVCNGG